MMKETVKLKCLRPWTGFELVDHLGDVRPCCWGKLSCGNINTESPEVIWKGGVFQYYREKMRAGETEGICSESCPILKGGYKERIDGQAGEVSRVELDPPRYLRVVPTTACNLACPMCYQIDAPATALPEHLFDLLEPWIASASELQILGGEPFRTKQCLEWIERVNPVDYPNCKLAAITNGLGFSDAICSLVARRRWSWILVSIDASSPQTYRRVRGGDFATLLENLDRLSVIRARARDRFEIRFGFTLQKSNLHEAQMFLDLCADYSALPQFTVVFGDWHGETPSTAIELRSFYDALEVVDKSLWQRGFGSQLLAGAYGALSNIGKRLREKNAAEPNPGGPAPATVKVARSTKVTKIALNLRSQRTAESILLAAGKADKARKNGKRVHLNVEIALPARPITNCVTKAWNSLSVDKVSVCVPFFTRQGKPISALSITPIVEFLVEMSGRRGWPISAGPMDLSSLGLEEENCRLDVDLIFDSRSCHKPALSVVSPIYNSATFIPHFLDSLCAQKTMAPIEIVLVDDGSTDGSAEASATFFREHSGNRSVRVLRRRRKTPYRAGTFTFSAGLARQVGIDHSVGDRVLFLDPDQYIEPGCVEEHIQLGGRGIDVVVGDRRSDDFDVWSEWSRLRSESLSAKPHWWLSFFTGNSSVQRALLERVGGFDPSLQYWGLDDTDLGYRLFKAGASVIHSPRSMVVDMAPERSGAGATRQARQDSYRLHMEVLYRKYLDREIVDAFEFLWR